MIDPERIFLDSNVLVYLVGEEGVKKAKVKSLANPDLFISTQVVAENVNACLRKLKLGKDLAFEHGKKLLSSFKVLGITTEVIDSAFMLSKKYQLSWWDSLIVSTALKNQCTTIYSEDMQDGLVIEQTLTIKNPFK